MHTHMRTCTRIEMHVHRHIHAPTHMYTCTGGTLTPLLVLLFGPSCQLCDVHSHYQDNVSIVTAVC